MSDALLTSVVVSLLVAYLIGLAEIGPDWLWKGALYYVVFVGMIALWCSVLFIVK